MDEAAGDLEEQGNDVEVRHIVEDLGHQSCPAIPLLASIDDFQGAFEVEELQDMRAVFGPEVHLL